MTPPRSNDMRLHLLENEVENVKRKLDETCLKVGSLEQTQISNHRDNRSSIHDLKGGQDTIMNQNSIAQTDITILKTKLDEVTGTDAGKPGKLDKISSSIEELGKKVVSSASIQSGQNWLYELGKMLLFGGVAAAAAHFAK